MVEDTHQSVSVQCTAIIKYYCYIFILLGMFFLDLFRVISINKTTLKAKYLTHHNYILPVI